MANPLTFMIQTQPTVFSYLSFPEKIHALVTSHGNFVTWWGGCLALFVCATLSFKGHKGAQSSLLGCLSGWLPFCFISINRKHVFNYYTIHMLPFLVSAIACSFSNFIKELDGNSESTWGNNPPAISEPTQIYPLEKEKEDADSRNLEADGLRKRKNLVGTKIAEELPLSPLKPKRNKIAEIVLVTFLVLNIVCFIIFFPVWTGIKISNLYFLGLKGISW